MKKNYMAPAAELIRFETESILDASNPTISGGQNNEYGDVTNIGGDKEVTLW